MEKLFNPENPKEEKNAIDSQVFKRELRIIGNVPQEKKEIIKEKYREYIYGGEDIIDMPREDLEKIKSIECEKTSQEIELIKAADDELSGIMQELGLESFNVPAENVHIFDSDLHEKKVREGNRIGGSAGFCSAKESFIGIPSKRRDNPFDFGAVVFHELNHLKGYKALKVDKINKTEIEEDKDENEIEEDKGILYAAKKALGLIRKPLVKSKKMSIGEIKEMNAGLGRTEIKREEKESDIKVNVYRSGLSAHITREKDERLTKIFEKQGKKIMLGDLIYSHFSGLEEAVVAKMEGKYCEKLLNNPIIKDAQKNKKINEFSISMDRGYPAAREVLDMIISGIYEKNKNNFKSEEDVFNIFIKAHFTGRFLPFSRLIKNTFGKESFEKVARMNGNSNISEARDALKIVKLREKVENLS